MTVFGNSPNACNEAYFELQHTYICGSTSCSFAPKVTITDNWGVNSAAAVYGGKITLMPSISITETIAGQ
jgi:hypothetical protein